MTNQEAANEVFSIIAEKRQDVSNRKHKKRVAERDGYTKNAKMFQKSIDKIEHSISALSLAYNLLNA